MQKQYEREEQQLEADLQNGSIDQAEYNSQMREMQRAYKSDMEESAYAAYEQELERW